ncbi:transposase [Streptomyces turgidiscabies]|uniref:Transposase n=1 Tax=Streptomyces turgidiscabies TaxID=85558 RepID=A0ABU0RW93_9ACTN|nr:transposase [Streptomyces turgidiscabies]
MSLSEISRETGLDRKTVRKYLSAPGPATPPRRSTNGRSLARVIDEFAPLIDSMLRAEVLMKAAVIHERLAREYGFTGNYVFARMKTWKILRDCRLKGDGVHHAMLGVARMHNLALGG